MTKKSVKFHIKSNDYFGTLAAVLSLVGQSIKDNKFKELNIKVLKNLEKDLMFLQKEYKIVKNKIIK